MKDAFKKAVEQFFTGYAPAPALEDIKQNLQGILEDKAAAMHSRGIIQEAALKKVLADFAKAVENATRAAPGDKQKRLEHLARHFGISPLGRKQAMLGTLAGLLALCGVASALLFWYVRREVAGALMAAAPFAALAVGTFVFLRLARYHAERGQTGGRYAAALGLGAAAATGALLAALAAVLF